MAVGDLHEISAAIGGLQADAVAGKESRRVLHEKQEEVLREMTEIKLMLAPVVTDVKSMKPEVEKFTRLHQRALGAVAVIALGFSLLGGVVVWAIEHVFNKSPPT